MKIKKLLAFFLCFVIIFAGLPVIAANAEETDDTWQWLGGYKQTITKDNYSKSCYGSFSLAQRGIIEFDVTKLVINNQVQKFYYKIYRASDDALMWSSNSDRLSCDSNNEFFAFVGLEAGNYVVEVTPSMYSSSFTANQSYDVYFGFYYYTVANNFEIEMNDEQATATPLSYGSYMRAFSDYSADWFAITATTDTLAEIKIKNFDKLAQNNVYVKFYAGDTTTADYLFETEAYSEAPYYSFVVMLKAGTNYLNITSCSKVGQQEYWIQVNKKTKLDTPVVYKKEKSGTTAKLFWEYVPGADGYEIQRKINKEGWKTVLTNVGMTRNGLTQSSSNFKNTYQFRIRAYKTINGSKIYSSWSKVSAFHPTPTNIKLSTSAYTYNGSVRKPKVTVKNALGVTLKEGVDYKLTYPSGRKYVGKYKIVVSFKGEYSGTKSVYFKINPKGTSVSSISAKSKSLKVKVKKQTSQTSGYQIQYSTSKKFSSAKTVTVKGNKNVTTTIKKLKGNKKYYVRVRTYKTVSGTKYYSSWSSAKSQKTKR